MTRDQLREAAAEWTKATSGGLIAFGRLGKALKPLIDRDGWPKVQLAFRHYLRVTEMRFLSPERFVATYGEWVVKPPKKSIMVWREIQVGQRLRFVQEEQPNDAA